MQECSLKNKIQIRSHQPCTTFGNTYRQEWCLWSRCLLEHSQFVFHSVSSSIQSDSGPWESRFQQFKWSPFFDLKSHQKSCSKKSFTQNIKHPVKRRPLTYRNLIKGNCMLDADCRLYTNLIINFRYRFQPLTHVLFQASIEVTIMDENDSRPQFKRDNFEVRRCFEDFLMVKTDYSSPKTQFIPFSTTHWFDYPVRCCVMIWFNRRTVELI